MNSTHFAAVLALSTALASPAAAQTAPVTDPGTWNVTPFLSVTFGGDGDSASLGLGAAGAYDLTTELAVEAELAYVFDLMGNADAADWSLLGVAANVLYHFPLENGMAPYATAGVGFGRSSLRLDGTAPTGTESSLTSTEIGFNLGGGLKAPLTDALLARGDIRYFNYNDAVPDGWRVYGGLVWRLR